MIQNKTYFMIFCPCFVCMLIYFICQTLQVLLTTFRLFNLQAEKRLVSMTRRDLSHNILEVAHTGGEDVG